MAFEIGQRVTVKTKTGSYDGVVVLVVKPNHNPLIEVRRHFGSSSLHMKRSRDGYFAIRDTESYIVRGTYRGLPIYYWPMVKDMRLTHG